MHFDGFYQEKKTTTINKVIPCFLFFKMLSYNGIYGSELYGFR